jgi:uncharacterized membrane protein
MKKKYFVILILSVIATINAAYLTYIAYSNSSSVCDISETLSCGNVLNSPDTQIFGIPFPAIALLVYPIIFLIAFFSHKKNRNNFKILLGISGGGILFNSYFIYQEYLLGSYCPLCLLCSIVIITIFILSYIETFKK